MSRVVLRVLAALLLAGGVLTGWGATLPESVTAERTARIEAPVQQLFGLVTDIEGQSQWRSDVGRIERSPGSAKWVEHLNGGGSLHFRTLRLEPVRLFEISWTSTLGLQGRWSGRFAPAPDSPDRASTVKFVETVAIPNPALRALTRLRGEAGGHLDLYLADLMRAVAKPRPPAQSRPSAPSAPDG